MKTIYLPAGTEYVPFDELALLIADALHPDTGEDNERSDYGICCFRFETVLSNAVKSGALPVKDAMTFDPHPYPVGRALQTALVSVHDLRVFLADRPIAIELAPEQSPATPAPAGADEIDFTMVATRGELIDAFGGVTKMDLTWFDNLTDAPKLNAARKYKGQGGRNSAEPLFCPFEVLQWLIDPKRKKGQPINDTTAWRRLKSHFPKVYNHHSIGDPNAD